MRSNHKDLQQNQKKKYCTCCIIDLIKLTRYQDGLEYNKDKNENTLLLLKKTIFSKGTYKDNNFTIDYAILSSH